MEKKGKKHDPEFMAMLQKHCRVVQETGILKFRGLYASIHIDIAWKGSVVSVPYSNIVWLLEHDRWPEDGKHIDHIDDDPFNNRPDNLQELSHEENQRKRRNRTVSRAYGTGKYGYGLQLHKDKRDARWYITRFISRGAHKEELMTKRISLGGYDTEEEAKIKIVEYAAAIARGETVDAVPARPKKRSIEIMHETQRIRALRAEGKTIEDIAILTGFSQASIYNKTKDMDVNRKKSNTGHRNIDLHQGSHRVRINRGGKCVYSICLASLQDAIRARDAWLLNEASGA